MDGFSLKWLANTALKLIKSVKLTLRQKFLSGHVFNCSLYFYIQIRDIKNIFK